jgi:hypothetical protein
MADFTCIGCGNPFQRASPTKYCSQGCQAKAENWASVMGERGEYKCVECQQCLPGTEFYWFTRKGRPAKFSRCHPCQREWNKRYRGTEAFRIYARKNGARHQQEHVDRCIASGGDVALHWYFTRNLSQYRARSKSHNLPCDLDAPYLVSVFHKQEGLCFYTKKPLQWDTRGQMYARRDSMSVDRLTPALGYTKGNIVLCTYTTNTAKGDRTEAEFYAFCEQVLQTRNLRQLP